MDALLQVIGLDSCSKLLTSFLTKAFRMSDQDVHYCCWDDACCNPQSNQASSLYAYEKVHKQTCTTSLFLGRPVDSIAHCQHVYKRFATPYICSMSNHSMLNFKKK